MFRADHSKRGEVSPGDVSVQPRRAEETHLEPLHTWRNLQLSAQGTASSYYISWLRLLICLFVNSCIINLCAFSLQNGCGSSAPCILQTPSSTLWSSPSASLDSWTSARMTRSSCSKQVSAALVPHGLQITNPWLYNRFLIRITLSIYCHDVAFLMWP